MAEIVNSIADLRALARRRVPRAIFEYADRGSYDEITPRRNREALDALTLHQRVMIDVSRQRAPARWRGRVDRDAPGNRGRRARAVRGAL